MLRANQNQHRLCHGSIELEVWSHSQFLEQMRATLQRLETVWAMIVLDGISQSPVFAADWHVLVGMQIMQESSGLCKCSRMTYSHSRLLHSRTSTIRSTHD